MATKDYIPADDAGLVAFAQTFNSYLDNVLPSLGLIAADITPLGSKLAIFSGSYDDNNQKQATARAARAAKDDARVELVTALRSLAKRIQAFPAVTSADLSQLGLTIKDTTPTAVPAPTSQPVLFVDTSNRLQHSVSFKDSLTPLSNAKPDKVHGCEIYSYSGVGVPNPLEDYKFLGVATKSPFKVDYGQDMAGKMVRYIARWANRNGQTGPLSDDISATVVG